MLLPSAPHKERSGGNNNFFYWLFKFAVVRDCEITHHFFCALKRKRKKKPGKALSLCFPRISFMYGS